MHWLANVVVYLIFKSRVVGDMVGYSLLYIHIWNSGSTCALRKSTLDMVLRTQEIKASLKECKMKNLPTTWVATKQLIQGQTLFTFMKRKWRPLELPSACEILGNKMIL